MTPAARRRFAYLGGLGIVCVPLGVLLIGAPLALPPSPLSEFLGLHIDTIVWGAAVLIFAASRARPRGDWSRLGARGLATAALITMCAVFVLGGGAIPF